MCYSTRQSHFRSRGKPQSSTELAPALILRTTKASPLSWWPDIHELVTFHQRAVVCSSIPICLPACFESTTTRHSNKQPKRSTNSNNGRSSRHISHSPGATTAVSCRERCQTSIRPDISSRSARQIGLFCGNTFATPSQAITTCSDSNRGALRVRIPADGTANDDHNPPRIAPRHLFDFSAGTDNLFRTEGKKVTLRFTVLNLTNKEALYNFQSTFSGTHFVSPRSFQGQIGLTF